MTKYKIYKVNDPIYRAHLSVIVGDLKKIKEYLKKCKFPEEKINEIMETDNGRFIFYNKMHIIILPKYDIYTLIHEIIHVAFAVMYGRGIPIKYENDEIVTYYVEMVLKNTLKVMNKKI